MLFFYWILSTNRTFQVSVRKVRSGGKKQDQVIRQDVVMAGNIEKVEEDARQADKKVQKNQRVIYSTNSAFVQFCPPHKAL